MFSMPMPISPVFIKYFFVTVILVVVFSVNLCYNQLNLDETTKRSNVGVALLRHL